MERDYDDDPGAQESAANLAVEIKEAHQAKIEETKEKLSKVPWIQRRGPRRVVIPHALAGLTSGVITAVVVIRTDPINSRGLYMVTNIGG